jgi:hypothetical protein
MEARQQRLVQKVKAGVEPAEVFNITISLFKTRCNTILYL